MVNTMGQNEIYGSISSVTIEHNREEGVYDFFIEKAMCNMCLKGIRISNRSSDLFQSTNNLSVHFGQFVGLR